MDSSPSERPRARSAQQREHGASTLLRLRRVRPATIRFTDPGVSDYEKDLASEVVVRISVRVAAPLDSQSRLTGGAPENNAHLSLPRGDTPAPRAPEVEVVLTVFSRHEDKVGSLMSSIRSEALPPPLTSRRLRLLHSGRLLADRGVLLVDWLDTLDARRASALAGTTADDFGFDSRHLPTWERTVTLAAAPPPDPDTSPAGEGDELAPLPPGAGDSVVVAGLRIPLAPLLHAVRPSVLAQHSAAPGLGRRSAGSEQAILHLPLQLPPDPAVLADLDAARAALALLVPQGMRTAWSSPLPHLLPLHNAQAEVLFDQGQSDEEGAEAAPAPPRNKDKGKARATETELTAMAQQGPFESESKQLDHAQMAPARTVASIASERVYLQCAVGAEDELTSGTPGLTPPPALEEAGGETASGLDQLVASGALSAEEVERIRRVFLYSRPELLRGRTGDALQAGDEEAHIRALEEQWLSSAGPMGTGEQGQVPAPTTGQGNASQAWIGMMVGFFFPFVALFFIADRPHPSFFPTLSSHPRVVESDSESDTEEDEEEEDEDEDEEGIDIEAELPAGAQTRPDDARSVASWEALDPNESHNRFSPSPEPSPPAEADDEPLSDLAARVAQRRAERSASARALRRRAEASRPQRRARPAPLVSLEWGDALRDALARGLRARRQAARWEARVTRERARRMAIEVRRRIRGGALVSPSVRSGIFVGLATNIFMAIFRWFFTPPP